MTPFLGDRSGVRRVWGALSPPGGYPWHPPESTRSGWTNEESAETPKDTLYVFRLSGVWIRTTGTGGPLGVETCPFPPEEGGRQVDKARSQ